MWYTLKGEYRVPRRYYFVAPKKAGTSLAALLANATKLRSELIRNWDKKVRHSITKTQEVQLDAAMLTHVNAFARMVHHALSRALRVGPVVRLAG